MLKLPTNKEYQIKFEIVFSTVESIPVKADKTNITVTLIFFKKSCLTQCVKFQFSFINSLMYNLVSTKLIGVTTFHF